MKVTLIWRMDRPKNILQAKAISKILELKTLIGAFNKFPPEDRKVFKVIDVHQCGGHDQQVRIMRISNIGFLIPMLESKPPELSKDHKIYKMEVRRFKISFYAI